MPVILLTIFIDLLGFGLIIPILPFLTLKYGGDAFDGTVLMSVYSFAAFAAGPVWGRLSDRFGRRPALIAALLGSMLSYIALALADSLATLFVARALSGLMAGNIGIVMAIAADLSDEQNRGKTMGRIGAMFGLGFAFGPFVGGLLGGVGDEVNILLPGLAAAALSFLATSLAYYFVPETNPKPTGDTADEPEAEAPHWSSVLKAPGRITLFSIFVVTAITQSTGFSITPFWTQAVLGWSESDVGFLYAGVGALIVVIQWLLIGPLFQRIGEARALACGAAVHVAGCLILLLAPGTVLTALIAFPMILTGLSLSFPALNSLLSKKTDRRLQGTALGLSNGLSALGRVIGPICAGLLFAAATPERPFVMVCAGGICVLVWSVLEARKSRPQPAGAAH
ncbi:MFS transporter [Kordiimonas marina]|uniref:MFS transporter n=1 Tax=Kordiimonas marina TaxID=2872312 RepID=UPI001FF5B736|nr:MFS transporter [Kordiimonas marina]MCJ9428388.1 MFS transporter [Kordiimonas marina]